ncbi:hypothetical protein [Nonomuraea sp. bgisy101]|uniref:hypothetical protein n=1 Tax=Nonomuraea sp. bgisy101 TaxID=3413784 RepID=UPI003D7489B2
MTNIRDLEPPPYVIPLSADGTELLSFEPREFSGWASFFAPQVPDNAMVFVRIGPQKTGRALEIRETRVVARSEGAATSGILRVIPWERIEAAINQPCHRAELDRLVSPAHVVADDLPGQLMAYTIRPEPQKPPTLDLKVEIPEGYRKPDEFYRRVGELFLALASISQRPAQELAEANDVKPTTIHRWTREAKLRGLIALPSDKT